MAQPTFTTTFYDSQTGVRTGVMCKGDCGAPCWMADAQAAAEGRRPTLAERLDSASDQLDNVLTTMCHSGEDWQRDLARDLTDAAASGENPLLERGYTAVREALSGVDMLALHVKAGDARTGEVFDDYLNPIAGMLRGAAFYLELDYARADQWPGTPAQRAALDRIRQLMVELGHHLDVAQDDSTATDSTPADSTATAGAATGGVRHGWSA